MEYKSSQDQTNRKEENKYDIGPGTAGVAQRISSGYEKPEEVEEETSGLFALTRKEPMPCSKNQY